MAIIYSSCYFPLVLNDLSGNGYCAISVNFDLEFLMSFSRGTVLNDEKFILEVKF